MNMENINTQPQIPESKSTTGWVFGWLSFIPLIGVLFGIVAIIIGSAKKNKRQIFLGMGGILFTILIYGSLFYFGFVAKTGVYADLKVQLVTQIINTDAGQIALYKNQNGKLPTKLSDLGTPSPTKMLFLTDPWMTELSYKPNNDGTFELRSAGPDKILNTADDINQTF
jgi:hypothetical protein